MMVDDFKIVHSLSSFLFLDKIQFVRSLFANFFRTTQSFTKIPSFLNNSFGNKNNAHFYIKNAFT